MSSSKHAKIYPSSLLKFSLQIDNSSTTFTLFLISSTTT